jgi:glycosyltransferase involved in cell wall biosynthesis
VDRLQWAVDASEEERALWAGRAMQRIERLYSWKVVTDQYEALLQGLIQKR